MAVSAPSLIAIYESSGNVTTSNVSLTAAAQVGDLIFVTIHAGSASPTLGVTDSKGHIWSSTPQGSTSTAPASGTRIYWTVVETAMTVSDSITVSRAPSGGLAWTASKVTGAASITGGAASSGSTTSVSGTSATVPEGGMMIMAITSRDAVTIAPGSGYTVSTIARSAAGNNPRGGGYIYRAAPSQTTLTPNATIEINIGWSAVQCTILPAEDPPTGFRAVEWTGTATVPLTAVEWDGTNAEILMPVEYDEAPPQMLSRAEVPPPFMGGYLGAHSENPDERYNTAFGTYPEAMTTYYQAEGRPGGTINLPAEQARAARGTIPLITVTSVNGPYTMAQIAAGDADSWISYWIAQLNAIGEETWFTFDHEFEVKLNQNKWSPAPTIPQYIAAFNRFIGMVKDGCPLVKSVYWYGYADTTKINAVGAGITPPDIIALDPYVFAHHSASTTFEQMVTPKLEWLRGRTWYAGQPIILAEYAKDSVHGDAQMASFYTNLRPRMASAGLAGAVLFARDKPGDVMANISGTAWPLARAAYRDSQTGGEG